MNYLELCQRLLDEADVNGTIGSTVGQSGEFGRVVNWIAEAYAELQTSKQTWKFLRSDKSVSLTLAGGAEYADATIARWRPDDFRIYLTATGVSDEQRIGYVPWNEYRQLYYIGTMRTETGRPTIFSIKPDNKLIFYQAPNASYTCQGEGYIVPDVLSGDTDSPLFPSHFHLILVWRALMLFGAWNSEGDKYTHGETEFKKLKRQLEADQLETFDMGEPLV